MNITYTNEVLLEITLPGQPYSTNSLYRYGKQGMYMVQKGSDLKDDYIYQLKTKSPQKPFEGDCELIVDLFFSTKHKRDWDNYSKIICDALEDAGVIADDVQIQTGVVRKHYDKDNPRMELTLLKADDT